MKQWIRIAAVAVSVLAAGQGFAQSLEKSYGDMCATPTKKKTEACQVMAKALVAKLQGDVSDGDSSAGASLPGQSSTAGTAKGNQVGDKQAALWRKRWGLYVDMVGKDWTIPGAREQNIDYATRANFLETSVIRYRWVVPGEELEMTSSVGGLQNKALLKWDAAEGRIVSGEGVRYVAAADGSIDGPETTVGTLTYRTRTVRLPDGTIQNTTEKKENGVWSVWLTGVLVERTASSMGQARQQLAAAEQERQAAERARAQEARQRKAERDQRFDRVMGSVYSGLVVANDVASANEAESRAALDATLAQAARQAGERGNAGGGGGADGTAGGGYQSMTMAIAQQPTQPSADTSTASDNGGAASAAPGRPLRFVLDIGLMNKPGDTVNPTCYSNVITRPGPPGWGGGGSLPEGSFAQARQEVDSLKGQFIARCRASGRDVTSEGNFHWTWNETRDGDQQVSNAHARYREDVSVGL